MGLLILARSKEIDPSLTRACISIQITKLKHAHASIISAVKHTSIRICKKETPQQGYIQKSSRARIGEGDKTQDLADVGDGVKSYSSNLGGDSHNRQGGNELGNDQVCMALSRSRNLGSRN
jgi:hypothetical protein